MVTPAGELKDYYGILGVTSNATIDEIRIVYRRLVLLYHPDLAVGQVDPMRIREINEAWEVLSDSVQREQYDRARVARGEDEPGPNGEQVFGTPEATIGITLTPQGPGHTLRLLFPEGEQQIRTDELGVASTTEYSAFLDKILKDASFNPPFVDTTGVIVGSIKKGIIDRFGKLPPNWDSLNSQLFRAYDEPLQKFLGATGGFEEVEGGRRRGRPRRSR